MRGWLKERKKKKENKARRHLAFIKSRKKREKRKKIKIESTHQSLERHEGMQAERKEGNKCEIKKDGI